MREWSQSPTLNLLLENWAYPAAEHQQSPFVSSRSFYPSRLVARVDHGTERNQKPRELDERIQSSFLKLPRLLSTWHKLIRWCTCCGSSFNPVLDIGNHLNRYQIVTYYSPPDERLPTQLFENILQRNSKTIFLGDLNAKHRSWSDTPENQKGHILYRWIAEKDLQVVNKLIRTSTRSKACIDLIITPVEMHTGTVSALSSIGSDHFPVLWSSPLSLPAKDRIYPIKRTYWTVYELFLSWSTNYWEELEAKMTDKIEFFSLCERFLALLAARSSNVTFRKSYKPSIPHIALELVKWKRYLQLIVRKTKHPRFIIELKQTAQEVKRILFLHKRNCWKEYCKSFNSDDVKLFWRKMSNHFKSTAPPIDGFHHNNRTISNPNDMCELAVDFYEEQFAAHPVTNSELETEAEKADKELLEDINSSATSVQDFKLLDVKKAIAALKNKSSSGVEGVSNRMIKLIPTPHLVFITRLFNQMARLRKTPKHWQTAKIILLPKTKSTYTDLNDTRPISLLPSFSKLYEKLFLVRLRIWIDENGILPDEQTGFRPKHDMSTRIIALLDQLGRCLSLNTAAAALFIDYKAAFNQLWIGGLWLKLQRLNCPTELHAWLRNYLYERNAFIEIKGHQSRTFLQHKGVPQGSCIGPRSLQASLRGRHGRDFLALPVLVLESHKHPTGQAGGKHDQQPAQVLHRLETTHEPKENVLDALPPPNISKNPNGLLWQSHNRTSTQVQDTLQQPTGHDSSHKPRHLSRTSTTPNAPALLARILPESGSTRQETIDCPQWKNLKQNQEPVSIECEKSPRPGLQFQLNTNHKSTTVVSPNGFFFGAKGTNTHICDFRVTEALLRFNLVYSYTGHQGVECFRMRLQKDPVEESSFCKTNLGHNEFDVKGEK
ncbi:unnamed protein product [Adineta ricciae]|uniref:Uncharacterized protein n=1 Tax=Adineta ricciae TaxID=249248 RepID=A0A815NQ46_ADIRI|nr:unnamed protein product [Adineta ricciae]